MNKYKITAVIKPEGSSIVTHVRYEDNKITKKQYIDKFVKPIKAELISFEIVNLGGN